VALGFLRATVAADPGALTVPITNYQFGVLVKYQFTPPGKKECGGVAAVLYADAVLVFDINKCTCRMLRRHRVRD